MDLVSWFPCVVAIRISNPFDKVLEVLVTSMVSVINDTLYLVFLFSINKVRWRLGEVGAMCSCFVVWS